jgi:hypothetical protein
MFLSPTVFFDIVYQLNKQCEVLDGWDGIADAGVAGDVLAMVEGRFG